MMVVSRPTTDQIWQWLNDVPDPEISVIDLGIVRNVSWHGETLTIAVTPTYAGCPATSVIAMDIDTAIRNHWITDVNISQQLSPAWTTEWLTETGRKKLESYGIAPRRRRVGRIGAPSVNQRMSSGSVNSAPPHAKRNGDAPSVWNLLIISNVSEA